MTSVQAFAVLSFASEAEQMIGHAICALETISSWSEVSKGVSPAQHLAWSDQLIIKMRDGNAVDVSVLVGKQETSGNLFRPEV